MDNMAVPPNVQLISLSFEQLIDRANKHLGLGNVSIASEYKLCDFMPTLGVLFAPELKGYTHW